MTQFTRSLARSEIIIKVCKVESDKDTVLYRTGRRRLRSKDVCELEVRGGQGRRSLDDQVGLDHVDIPVG